MDARDVGASTVVEVRALSKRYGAEGRKHDGSVTQALDRVSFAVACGEFTGIMGPSGSGKSTLLNCLATIDKPSSGTIVVGGRDVTALAGKELAKFRREDLGFIFQDSNLLDTLTAYENIALALTVKGEPTGALDSKSARQLLESLAHLNERGSTILMVTHDSFSASYCNRIVFIKDGGLYGELRRNGTERSAFYRRIVDVVSSMGGAGEDDAADEVTRHAC